jgi:hypothetical protein
VRIELKQYATIAAKYEDVMSEYRTLRFTRNELYDLLLEGKDLGAIHDANERLTEALTMFL